MGFIILLLLSALTIAGSAAFFSVYGLARVFSGSFWSVVIMATSLEGGKLTAASFLYRYWKTLSKAMRAYLLAAVVGIMIITSMGIFGYLSSAYQDNILPYQTQQQQIQLLETDKGELEKLKIERLARQEEINKQIANLPSNFVNGRRRLQESFKDELVQINKDIASYTTQIRDDTTKISTLKNQTIQETAHVGPIIFIASAFGLDVNSATKWLITLIILVFDPLAVILTVGANMALVQYKKEKEEKQKVKIDPIASIPEPTPVEPAKIDPIVEIPQVTLPLSTQVPTFTGTAITSPFSMAFEPSDPPIIRDGFIQSKDGMTWRRVAPDASAPMTPTGEFHTVTVEAPTIPITVLPQTTTMPGSGRSIFERAHELLNKPHLTEIEKRTKHVLEHTLSEHLGKLTKS